MEFSLRIVFLTFPSQPLITTAMAEPLKNKYNKKYIRNLALALKEAYPQFNSIKWTSDIFDSDWKNKELKQRMHHIAYCLHQHLPLAWSDSLDLLKSIAPQFTGFEALFFPHFVEIYGQAPKHLNESLDALIELTQYSSSEFAVRPFILKNPKKMMQWMLKLSKNKNHHVRRLASEGCRPRLPWGRSFPLFKKDPSLILPILENLKNDRELYVQKSVANNLNDIAKDNPEIVLKLLTRWNQEKPTKQTQWIIRHSLRSLIKKGNPQALKLIGYSFAPDIKLSPIKLSHKTVKLGDSFTFEFKINSQRPESTALMIDYRIYFVKKNGSLNPKVFKLSKIKLDNAQELLIQKKHSLKEISTRQYHAGKHYIEIQINGVCFNKTAFTLIC